MYIRTDFHIYEIKSEEIIQGEKYYNIEIRGSLNKLKAEFGKQSENLEELCDEFIDIIPRENGKAYHDHWEWSVGEKRFYNDIGESVPFDYFSDDTYFRGAIWTDKGLIYVAKMNDKGELELI